MSKLKILTFFFIVLLFVVIFKTNLISYLDIEFILSKKDRIFLFYERYPLQFIFSYFCFYVFCAAFSIPGAAILTLVSGFIFGFAIGSLVVSLGSTIGAVFAFLISRFLLKDFIQKKFIKQLNKVNAGLKQNGVFYLLSLRLIPLIPFVLLNVLMGVTSISIKQYTIGSFLGMLPAAFVFVNAGSQLSYVTDVRQIFSLKIILSFLLLALLPWLFKWLFIIYKKLYK